MRKVTLDLDNLENFTNVEKRILEEFVHKYYDVKLGDVKPGSTLMIGNVEFIVLRKINQQVPLLIKDIWKPNVQFSKYNCPDYNYSDIKTLIETEFVHWLEQHVSQNDIMTFECDLTTIDGFKRFEKLYKRKASLLPFNIYRDNIDIIHLANCQWWLCNAWTGRERIGCDNVAAIFSEGGLTHHNANSHYAVRPLCQLSEDAKVIEKDGKYIYAYLIEE